MHLHSIIIQQNEVKMIEMKCNKNENKTQKVWIKESKNCIYKLSIIFASFFKKIHKLKKASGCLWNLSIISFKCQQHIISFLLLNKQ